MCRVLWDKCFVAGSKSTSSECLVLALWLRRQRLEPLDSLPYSFVFQCDVHKFCSHAGIAQCQRFLRRMVQLWQLAAWVLGQRKLLQLVQPPCSQQPSSLPA